jgi:two-component system OmpR family sensor kinase
MFRTIYGKLSAIMLGLFYAVGFLFILGTLFSNRMYFQEANQRLNRNVAKQFVSKQHLLVNGQVNRIALDSISRDLMAINHTADIYLLDLDGLILYTSVGDSMLRVDRVSMEPIYRFSAAKARFPILGDNPREPSVRRIFSACPIPVSGEPEVYLYITLGEGELETITGMLKGSYIVNISILAALASLLLVSAVGLLLFKHLTRRLRRLSMDVENFKIEGFNVPFAEEVGHSKEGGDEIDRLQFVFREMASMITVQVRELREADSLRRELVTNVSHDLRTPLTSMQGYLETLAVKKDLTADERKEYLDRALGHSDRLRRLISDLFELARLDAHEVKAHPEPFALGELALDVLQKFHLLAEDRGVKLTSDMDPHLPLVMADIGLVERALENLIKNAIQYTPKGGVVTLTILPGQDQLTVEIADTGKGMKEEDLPHIFDRYYRAGSTEDDAADGTGLGLAITKRIVELHGSTITVSSRPGEGSLFTFALPLSQSTIHPS